MILDARKHGVIDYAMLQRNVSHETMNPPIEAVPCIKCGVPSAYQNVEGGWCGGHWPESVTVRFWANREVDIELCK